MNTFRKHSNIMITCPWGNSPYLADEVVSLGLPVRTVNNSSVLTEGTLEEAMVLNLRLRTGHRVLFLLQSFNALNPEDLYGQLSQMPWESYISGQGYLSVTSYVDNSRIKDSRYANLKAKDAIVDRLRKLSGRRPDSGPEKKGVVVFFYWKENACSVYIDTSGQSLSHRGYRKIPLKAPLRESVAAAILLASGWKGEQPLVNPMCGSGTIAIEAALIALGKPPGLLRSHFGFMQLKGFGPSSWQELRKQARRSAKKAFAGRIIASDVSREAVEAARKNATTAGVDHLIEFHVCDYGQTPVPAAPGIIIVNPAYGERLGETAALEAVYAGIGNFFKKDCSGYRGYIFTGNLELAKKVGLRTKRRLPFYNGKLECRLLEYELYSGSKKLKKQQ